VDLTLSAGGLVGRCIRVASLLQRARPTLNLSTGDGDRKLSAGGSRAK
jgi:hypothetical protein